MISFPSPVGDLEHQTGCITFSSLTNFIYFLLHRLASVQAEFMLVDL